MLGSSLVTCHLSLLAFADPATTQDPLDGIREAFLAKINATRQQAALSPLRLSASLSRVAQRRAEEIGAGEAPGEGSVDRAAQAASKAGYESRFLAQIFLRSEEDIDEVYADAARPEGPLGEGIGRPELRDLGVGIAPHAEPPVYVLLLGLSWEDFAAGKRAEFSDLTRVRRQMLERVNRERTSHGLGPLLEQPLLNEAAQRHADDMLARSYYGHESPEGSTVLERSRLAGYRPRFAGENVAQGQSSVEEVMAGWMASAIHREHILSSLFVDFGSGVAVGKNANGYQFLWVQCFGRPKDGSPPRRRRPQRRTEFKV